MKSQFERYPEIVLMDATHKTNNLDMPFYTMATIDGNGETQPVASFLVENEDEESIRCMMQLFKKGNPNWCKIEVFITDKDMTERNVIKSEIAQVHLQICLFHVMRTFHREVTMEKMGITSTERDTIKSQIKECAYSYSDDIYDERYSQLMEVCNDKVKDYYNKNWHPIKDQWVEGLKSRQLNLEQRTNNRLESFFQKLKQCTKSRGTLQEIISGFMDYLSTMRSERHFKRVQGIKVSTEPFSS